MIKELSIEDSESFLELGNLINPNFCKTHDLAYVIDEDCYCVYGYYEKGKLIAFLLILITLDSDDICDIVVDPDYRKKGIASKLLDNYFSSKNDGDFIFLDVNVNNVPAINLYKKYGFEVVNIRKGYYDGVDGYLMEKMVKR